MKAYKFDNKNPITVLPFLAQFKRACDSNRVSEGMPLCIVPTFMKDGPVSSLTVEINLYEDDGTTHRLLKAGEKQISTFVEDFNFLIKSYTTESNIAKATLEIAALRKTPIETSVKFVDVLRTTVVRCGNAYSEKSTKKVLIGGLPANI